jgi:hypothetical protein
MFRLSGEALAGKASLLLAELAFLTSARQAQFQFRIKT